MDLRARIKEAREAKGLKQKEMAEILKIDPSQYSKIERGIIQPTIQQLMDIGVYCEKSLDWLVYGKEVDSNISEPQLESAVDWHQKYQQLEENLILLRENNTLKDEIIKELRSKVDRSGQHDPLVVKPLPQLKK